LGGTRIKLGLLKNNTILEKKIFDAESAKGLEANLHKLETVIDDLLEKHQIKPNMLQGIGLSFPGLVDPVAKKIISTNKKYDDGPQLHLQEWATQKWNAIFYIENDARMAAVGEWIFGAGRGSNDVVVVTIGTGIGTSAIIEGRLLRGKHFQAGCLGGHFRCNTKGISAPAAT